MTFFSFSDTVVNVGKIGTPFYFNGDNVPKFTFCHFFAYDNVGIGCKCDRHLAASGVFDLYFS